MMKKILIIFFLLIFLSSGTQALSIESLKINGGGFITSLAVSPSSPNIIYAASDLGGMYKSVDYAENWVIISRGLITDADLAVATIGIDPKNPDVVYIGTGKMWGNPPGDNGGIFKTVNGGTEWKLLTRQVKFASMGTFDVEGRMIVVDPKNSNIVYAGSHRDGIFKSTDGGASWSLKGLAGKYISSVVIDPKNSNTIYVSSQIAVTSTPGIYKSTDGGNTWKTLTTAYNVYDLTIDAQNPQILYAAAFDQGVYKSTNGGASWSSKTPSGTLGSEFVSVSASPTNPNVVYAKTRSVSKVYRTSNGGNSWSASTSANSNGWYTNKFGLSSSGITVDPTNPDRAYSGTWHAVWRTDDGSSWTVKPYGLETSAPQAIEVNPKATNEIYTCLADIGFFKSVDRGETWTRIPEIGGNCWAIAIDGSTNPVTVYAGTGSYAFNKIVGGKIFKSTNNGGSWVSLNVGGSSNRIRSITIDPTNPSIVYAGLTNGEIYKSTNKGSSWTKKSSGLLLNSYQFPEIFQIAINPSSPNIVYAAVRENGIYKSTNGGDSWSSINSGIGKKDAYDVVIDPNNPNIVYVANISTSDYM